jgi:hypothetical protein
VLGLIYLLTAARHPDGRAGARHGPGSGRSAPDDPSCMRSMGRERRPREQRREAPRVQSSLASVRSRLHTWPTRSPKTSGAFPPERA